MPPFLHVLSVWYGLLACSLVDKMIGI